MSIRLVVTLLAATVGLAQVQNPRPTDLVGKRFGAHVVGIVDGDTVRILIPPSRRLDIRIFGIDTPERAEPFSDSAARFARVLMFDKDVTLVGQDVDRYGRLVARISVAGVDASATILSAGLACHYRQYSNDQSYESAERAARAANKGFWAPGVQQPGCVAREAKVLAGGGSQPTTPAYFIGNVSSHVYHAPTCKNANCKNCTRKFNTRREAETAGFRAAGDCLKAP